MVEKDELERAQKKRQYALLENCRYSGVDVGRIEGVYGESVVFHPSVDNL